MMSDCILWDGPRDTHGYGRKYVDGMKRQAHRVAYCAHHGLSIYDISGWVIRHMCDNPPCVNPDHLKIGTHADNVQDKVDHGRQARQKGEEHGQSKLTEQQVLAIKASYSGGGVSQRGLALVYGVSQKAVWAVLNGTRWRHLNEGERKHA